MKNLLVRNEEMKKYDFNRILIISQTLNQLSFAIYLIIGIWSYAIEAALFVLFLS